MLGCRHLIGDRLDITGARWGLDGAEAVLRLRALTANNDLDAYRTFHTQREHQRLHPSLDQAGYTLTAWSTTFTSKEPHPSAFPCGNHRELFTPLNRMGRQLFLSQTVGGGGPNRHGWVAILHGAAQRVTFSLVSRSAAPSTLRGGSPGRAFMRP